jgi:hypothetical protein
MHKSATKCNETLGKWCKNKHGASKIIDTLETYQPATQNNKVGTRGSRQQGEEEVGKRDVAGIFRGRSRSVKRGPQFGEKGCF